MQKVHVNGKGKSICALCLVNFFKPMTTLFCPLIDDILMSNAKHSLMLNTDVPEMFMCSAIT